MKIILIAWFIFMIIYVKIERNNDRKRKIKYYIKMKEKINQIRRKNYIEAGILDKYKDI